MRKWIDILKEVDLEIKNYLDSTELLDVNKVCELLSKAYCEEVTWNGFQFRKMGDLFHFHGGKLYNMTPTSPYAALLATKFIIQWLDSLDKGE